MTLIDLLRSPWAILPDRLDEIQAVYATHLRGDKIDIEAVEARLGRPLANDQQEYTVREGGVAVLALSGAISPKANLFTRVSGGASAQVFAQQIESMAADPRVRSVVIDMDSPGGNVLGIPAAARALAALAAEKPTVTVCTGTMASAAYWIGSAANAVYISGETDFVGSIGVVAKHSYDPKSGGTTTEITAGKYKRIASDSAPLSAEGKAYMQAQVDQLYSVFVDAVASHRRVSADQVLQHMADGRVFVGQQAIDAGLVDGIATVEDMVAKLAAEPTQFEKRRKARIGAAAEAGVPPAAAAQDEPVSPVATETLTGVDMTAKELAAKFAAENPEAAALIRAEGATAELARAQAVREQLIPGHESLVAQLAADGKTTGPEAAVAILAAERSTRQAVAQARNADAPAPVDTPAAEAEPAPASGRGDVLANPEALDAAVRKHMAAHKTDYLAALSAVTQGA